MFACLLDLCGTMNRCLKVVKDYSIGNVITGNFSFMNFSLDVFNTIATFLSRPRRRRLYTWRGSGGGGGGSKEVIISKFSYLDLKL